MHYEMSESEICFDMLLEAPHTSFLTWFQWEESVSLASRIYIEKKEYRITFKITDPGDTVETAYPEILFYGELLLGNEKGRASVVDDDLGEDYLRDTDEFLGFIQVRNITEGRTQLLGVSENAYFDEYLINAGTHIANTFPTIHRYVKGEKPQIIEKPLIGDPDEKWFEYYHWCKWDAGIHYTFKDMGKDRKLSPNTCRKRHIACPICSVKKHERK